MINRHFLPGEIRQAVQTALKDVMDVYFAEITPSLTSEQKEGITKLFNTQPLS